MTVHLLAFGSRPLLVAGALLVGGSCGNSPEHGRDAVASLGPDAAVARDAADPVVARDPSEAGAGGDAADIPTPRDAADAMIVRDAAIPERDARPAASQVPPQGRQALSAWLASGAYKSWRCESNIMAPRPNGAHGRNRVCSNDALASHTAAGPYPVGAASVKELYDANGRVTGQAVAVKLTEGTDGRAWYWYEGGIEGIGVPLCVNCHAMAPNYGGRDFVYVQVR